MLYIIMSSLDVVWGIPRSKQALFTMVEEPASNYGLYTFWVVSSDLRRVASLDKGRRMLNTT